VVSPEAVKLAWSVRENAHIIGPTKVGAVAIAEDGSLYGGCNVEHKYRCHDVHAEVNAISSMVAAGHTKLAAILIVAERESFTPCGSCMDWIFQFGYRDTDVCFVNNEGAEFTYTAGELMPHYPR
jgi:cytidine deaminase